jgi:putative endonuclease
LIDPTYYSLSEWSESKGIIMQQMAWKWYVYILECDDKSYYTGLTWKPDARWTQHLAGLGSGYTASHKPKRVAYLEEYENLEEARRRERQIKGWKREKKKKLIEGKWGRW